MNERTPELPRAARLRPWTLAEVLLQERAALALSNSASTPPTHELPARAAPSPALAEVVASIHRDAKADPNKAAAGLCLSGGGIRSATFSLGVLQALAGSGLLPRFDYLSTVSGGGYLGSWLSAWIHREKNPALVFETLVGTKGRSIAAPEPPQIEHLRRYSNYLSPRFSVGSADTWALAGIFLRNLVLNWLVLLPVLFVVMLLPRFFIAGIQTHGGSASIAGACIATALALFVSTWYAAIDLPSNGGNRGTDAKFALWRLLPLIIGAHALALAWAWVGNAMLVPSSIEALAKDPRVHWIVFEGSAYLSLPWGSPAKFPLPEFPFYMFMVIVVEPIVLGAVGGWLWVRRRTKQAKKNAKPAENSWDGLGEILWRMAVLFVATTVGTAGIAWLTRCVFPMPGWDTINYTAFSPTLILTVFLIANFLVAGLSSWVSTEADREWWGRASGWILAAVIASGTIGAVVFWGPIWLDSLTRKFQPDTILASLGGISGVFGGIAALLGASGGSEAKPSRYWLQPKMLSLGAVIFVVLLGMLFSYLVDECVERTYNLTFDEKGLPTVEKVAMIACAAAVLTLVMGKFVNVNRFSVHMMYRNRLVRAYLGASRRSEKRHPHPFTGFDERDDLRLHELGAQRPLHIINITLNLVGGDNLAWQERRAESFTASPLHCGSWQLMNESKALGSYQPSRYYGGDRGLRLGTAFAVSGAAANPNSGYHSSSVVTLLMTLFNVRLGWWLPNPGPKGADHWRASGPSFALTPLMAEAFGMTNQKRAFVNLSDGGHFDNMGLYEMLVRRCHFIIVVDGEQDPLYSFEGLSECIRKTRIDLGIDVEIDLSRIKADPPKCCAMGRIHYSRIDGPDALDGWLLYIKPVILGTEPADVRHYRDENAAFPHESTGDQFFSESQFESYRALGQHLGFQIGLAAKARSLAALFAQGADYAGSLRTEQLEQLKAEAG